MTGKSSETSSILYLERCGNRNLSSYDVNTDRKTRGRNDCNPFHIADPRYALSSIYRIFKPDRETETC